MAKLRAVVIGATGLAGQQFLAALADHPQIDITGLAASPRSAGKTYEEALKGSSGMVGWFLPEPLPSRFAQMTVLDGSAVNPADYDLAFSAVESDVARELEPRLAQSIPVVSTASAFRYEDDVPLVIPPVNADHAQLVRLQQEKRGTRGYILPIPNCTTTGLALALAPLKEAFGVKAVMLTSLQAISGAGRSPGVIGLDITDNVIPHIPNEEEKVEVEATKILGRLVDGTVERLPLKLSATCTRVAVLEGHTEAVSVSLGREASLEDVAEVLRSWKGQEVARGLPSAPEAWIRLHEDPFRPQPRLDRDAGNGMVTSVGRLRKDAVLENGIKFVLVSHNTKMGAAKGAILVAEQLLAQGLMGR
ncbi:MAG TPA: aspartate-semialdehyde dehydrogenase [Myxococcaceae bacterium]|nr:aspartate-semialdehyde dehydrogenase [Myxococcaceae bacterium]